MNPFYRLYLASSDVLEAKRALALAQARKEAALVAINEGGCPKRQVSQRALDHLRSIGFTEGEISLLGLSQGSVRLALSPGRTSRSATGAGRQSVSSSETEH